jgi:Pyruvate/2-oxoacid:ferredoxin oxidoreductase gamma subunit
MIMLGALLEIAASLPQASVDRALARLVKNPKWVALDERALARGRELFRESCRNLCPDSLPVPDLEVCHEG